MRESVIENRACEYAEDLGYIGVKFTPAGQRGWPDRLFINASGVHVYIEFKRPKKNLERLQAWRKKQLLERGCYCYGPISSLEEVKLILDTHYDETRMDPPRIPSFCVETDDEAG